MHGSKVRTTVALSSELLAAIDLVIREGKTESRSDFLDLAVRNQLAAEERARIDAQFARMAGDADYQREAEEVAGDLATSDWEALKTAEGRS
jgi:metal-responsive CopG/Arc/MetJ family transcriptional regulator